MIVEAIKVEKGFFIPDTDFLKAVKKDRFFLDVRVSDFEEERDAYQTLDDLIGLCETKVSNGSVTHDSIIYGQRGEK